MEKDYYYLIAGLPDLVFDDHKISLSFPEIISEIFNQVYSTDVQKIKTLLYHFDNQNLITKLQKDEVPFDNRGLFSEEELVQEIKEPKFLPQYMKNFLKAYEEEKYSNSDLLLEDQLNWLFYEEMIQHPNQFLREWFRYNLDLRNIISGLNNRKIKIELENYSSIFSLKKILVCDNNITENIRKSKETDFSLSDDIPWIEQLLLLYNEDLVTFEQGIDKLRWEKVNELTIFSYFHVETILAFIIKLEIVTRWQSLKPELGGIILQKLLTEMKTGYDIEHQFL